MTTSITVVAIVVGVIMGLGGRLLNNYLDAKEVNE